MASYRSLAWLFLALGCGQWPQAIAAEPAPSKPSPPDEQSSEGVPAEAGPMFRGPSPTWKTHTSGGVQLWADELCFHDWRIQRNVLLGHYRLLDGENNRHAWGSFEQCQQKLEEIKRELMLPPMQGRAVVMLHGLGSWRNKMTPLADYLKENGNFAVFNLAYPSTRGEIAEHARCLAKVIQHLDGIDEINFVAHSMGNLVVRHYLADMTDEALGRKPDPRIKRFVMLAPPNHGASAALMLKDHELIGLLMGSSASELGVGWAEVEKHLAIPSCEFGIIAGGRGRDRGFNPLMEGDNDDLLPVSTTRLVGARDFVLVPVIHQFTMLNPDVQRYALSFLNHGYFVSAEERKPSTTATMQHNQNDPHEFLASLEVAPAPHVNDDLIAPGKRHCPICGFLMETRLQAGLNIDVCAEHGIWLDNGKFDSLASTVSVSSARKQRWELEKAQRRGKMKGTFFGWCSFFID